MRHDFIGGTRVEVDVDCCPFISALVINADGDLATAASHIFQKCVQCNNTKCSTSDNTSLII